MRLLTNIRHCVILLVLSLFVLSVLGCNTSTDGSKSDGKTSGLAGDGVGVVDTDGDGMPDATAIDNDGDGIADGLDLDNDGFIDTPISDDDVVVPGEIDSDSGDGDVSATPTATATPEPNSTPTATATPEPSSTPTATPVSDDYFATQTYAFDSTLEGWSSFSISGNQTWVWNNAGGKETYASMSGYSDGDSALNEDWLISPSLDTSETASITLSFDNTTNYGEPSKWPLEVYYSTNYSGSGTPNSASWTKINGFTFSAKSSSWVFVNSGEVDIAVGYAATTYIAFKYYCDNEGDVSNAITWEVDDIVISGPKDADGDGDTGDGDVGDGDGDGYTGDTGEGSYYNSIDTSLNGNAFKSELKGLIRSHTTLSYGALWDAYDDTDLHRNDSDTAWIIWDMYSDNPNGPESYTYTYGSNQCGNYSGEGSCYNREHSWPKSWFDDNSPMYSDLVHLVPTDGYVNGRRSNYPFGEVASASWTSKNGSKLGDCATSGYSGTVFEPIDEYKGDFARIYFYMATCYYGEMPTGHGQGMTNGSDIYDWAEAMLRRWHEDDPVSQKEIDRNNAIKTIQGNRNPFVDHPEWVNKISDF